MDISPIPHSSGVLSSPLIAFQQDWNRNYAVTQSQELARDAAISVNDGSRFGALNRSVTGYP